MGWHNNFPDRLLLIDENKTGYTYTYIYMLFFPLFPFLRIQDSFCYVYRFEILSPYHTQFCIIFSNSGG